MKEEYLKHMEELEWDCTECSEYERLDNQPLLRHEKCDMQCEVHFRKWLHEHEHMARW